MAVTALKTWLDGEILTAADLNAMNTNILSGGIQIANPLPGTLELATNGMTDLASLVFANSAADPDTAGYLARNQALLSYFDGTRAQVPCGIEDDDETTDTNSGTSEVLGGQVRLRDLEVFASLPRYTNRTDWLLEYHALVDWAGTANLKTGYVVISTDGPDQALAVAITNLGAAAGVQGGLIHFWVWGTGTNTQQWVSLYFGRGQCQVFGGTLALNQDSNWTFVFAVETVAVADVTYYNSRLWVAR